MTILVDMPPSIDVDALSGILGSISIACWLVVFLPQIFENFRRSSADGLSVPFIVIWLLGDVFNIVGAILQKVLPTMTILAVYYTLADVVLLGQCLWYKGWTLKDNVAKSRGGNDGDGQDGDAAELPTEESPLLGGVDGATAREEHHRSTSTTRAMKKVKSRSALWTVLFNISALIAVCGLGALGWWLSACVHFSGRSGDDQDYTHLSPSLRRRSDPVMKSSSTTAATGQSDPQTASSVTFDTWGQVFGYLCAALYLGSRIPQLLLNYRRKSTHGISLLFFLFACVGNLTYVLSIFAYEPSCARLEEVEAVALSGSDSCGKGEWASQYGRYILVNASWLIGSAGTFLLDLIVFVQFWIYRNNRPPGTGEVGDGEDSS